MQVDISLLKSGQTATSHQVDRLGLSPLPITTHRNPIAISQYITIAESDLLKIRLVNTDVHLTQMLFSIEFIISTMIFFLAQHHKNFVNYFIYNRPSHAIILYYVLPLF